MTRQNLRSDTMDRGNFSRRGFMQRSLAGLVGCGLPLWYAREVFGEAAKEAAARKAVAANDRIVMGAIGIGSPASRNRALYNDARRHKDKFGVQFIAACDVDGRHLNNALGMMKKD